MSKKKKKLNDLLNNEFCTKKELKSKRSQAFFCNPLTYHSIKNE